MPRTGGEPASRRSIAAAAALLLYGALHLLPFGRSPLFPYFWGVHFASLLSPAQVSGAIGVSLIAALLFLSPRGQADSRRRGIRRTNLPAYGAALAIFAAALIFFPIRTAFLGDGYLVTTAVRDLVEQGFRASAFTDAMAREFLSLRILGWLAEAGGAGGTGSFAFRTAGAIGAALFAAGAFLFARGRNAAGSIHVPSLLALFSLPACGLFFGYVETYALFAGTFLLCAALMSREHPGGGALALEALLLGVLLALHIAGVVLLAGFALRAADLRGARSWRYPLCLAAPVLLYILLALACEVPLSRLAGIWDAAKLLGLRAAGAAQDASASRPYGFFSWRHLADLANLLLLAAPLLLLLPLGRGRGKAGKDRAGRFLLPAVAASAALCLLFRSDIGMSFDWDILSVVLLPLPLFVIRSMRGFGRQPRFVTGAALFVLALHQLLWMQLLLSEGPILERTRRMAFCGGLTPEQGREAAVRNIAWYIGERNDPRSAERILLDYLDLYPASKLRPLLASLYERHGMIGPAIIQLRRAIGGPGYHFPELRKLGELYTQVSQPDSAVAVLREALAAREDAGVLGLLGYAFALKGAWDSSRVYAERSIRADPEGYYGYYVKGLAAQAAGDGAGMLDACERILRCRGVPPGIRRSAEEVVTRSGRGN